MYSQFMMHGQKNIKLYLYRFRGLAYCHVLVLNIGVMFRYIIHKYVFDWQVYIQHLRVKQPDKPRKLYLTLKNKESRRFTKCFHGWGPHKRPPE